MQSDVKMPACSLEFNKPERLANTETKLHLVCTMFEVRPPAYVCLGLDICSAAERALIRRSETGKFIIHSSLTHINSIVKVNLNQKLGYNLDRIMRTISSDNIAYNLVYYYAKNP